MPRPAIVYTLIHPETGNLILEHRLNQSKAYHDQVIFPGGTVENEDLLVALSRDVLEEMDITVIRAIPIPTDHLLFSPSGKQLHPFLILEFTGQIPKNILDTNNPIIQVPLSEILNSPIDMVKQIALGLSKLKSA